MRMHNPPHPGEVLKTLCLEPLNLSVTETAKALGVSRKTLSDDLGIGGGGCLRSIEWSAVPKGEVTFTSGTSPSCCDAINSMS